mmetsp:Transcript_18549/g.58899  ORF Transcript_18549/g.58899 Transcript_18549/m.58899 type:complete len:333 (+) Transcript_18549:145-1143(+)
MVVRCPDLLLQHSQHVGAVALDADDFQGRTVLNFGQTGSELIDAHLTALVVVQHVEDMLDVASIPRNLLQQFLDLRRGRQHLRQLEHARPILVHHDKQLLQLVNELLPFRALELRHLLLVPGGLGQRRLHHERGDQVHQGDGDYQDECDEVEEEVRLHQQDWPVDAAHAVQRQALQEREHCPEKGLEVLLDDLVVQSIGLWVRHNQLQTEHSENVQYQNDDDKCPSQCLQRVHEPRDEKPQRLELHHQPQDPRQPRQSKNPNHHDLVQQLNRPHGADDRVDHAAGDEEEVELHPVAVQGGKAEGVEAQGDLHHVGAEEKVLQHLEHDRHVRP